MGKLQAQLQYEAKAEELRNLVKTEAIKLQNVLESKETATKNLAELAEQKSRLLKQISDLQLQIIEAEKLLDQTIKRKTKFIDTAKVELAKERSSVEETRKNLSLLITQAQEFSVIVDELKGFIAKEIDARTKYLEEQKKFQTFHDKNSKIIAGFEAEKKMLAQEKEENDRVKKYLSDFYGKIAQYVTVAKQTVIDVNKALEENVPLRFGVPPGEIIEINFDNFNQKPSKS